MKTGTVRKALNKARQLSGFFPNAKRARQIETFSAFINRRLDECDGMRAEVERLRVPALALELLKGEGWAVADYVAKAENIARARPERERL